MEEALAGAVVATALIGQAQGHLLVATRELTRADTSNLIPVTSQLTDLKCTAHTKTQQLTQMPILIQKQVKLTHSCMITSDH